MTKISSYALMTVPDANDVLPVVDVDDLSMAPTGTTKKITVASLQANVPFRVVPVDAYGADPTGVADSTAAFLTAQAAGGAGPYRLVMSAGTYLLGTGADIGTFGRGQGLMGQGSQVTKILYAGNGTCVSAFDGSFSSSLSNGGEFGGFSIAPSGTPGANAIGFGWGNLNMARCRDIAVSGFSGASGVGISFKNVGVGAHSEEASWTAIKVTGCTVLTLWDTNSFDYSVYDFLFGCNANQDAVRLQNNASIEGCAFAVRGNFNTGVTNTGAVFAIDRGNGAGTSRIDQCRFDVQVECDGATGVGHFTVLMQGGSSSQFTGTGCLVFNDETVAFQGASLTVGTQQFGFSGLVIDAVLGKMSPGDAAVFHGGTQWTERNSLATSFSGTIFIQYGDINAFKLASGANSLAFAGHLERARKMDLFIAQPASGAAGTVTWPANVWFPAGAPVLSAANGAVDHVRLAYLPAEGNWYGEFHGNYLAAATAAPAPPSYQSLLIAPAGALAETFPRRFATLAQSALTSGTLYVTAIPLLAGTVVSNITMVTNTTAKTGGTHGWYILCDSGMVCRAVTADKTDAATTWGSTSNAVTLAVGTPYVVPASGLHYIGVMVAATGMPTFSGSGGPGPAGGINNIAPVMAGTSSTGQTTPPSTGTGMTAISASGGYQFYAYVS